MTFKLFIIPAAVISIIYGFAMASVASADATVIVHTWDSECALVDDMVECDITSPSGISNVNVAIESGIGDVTVFDESYEGCPTEVHVSLDPIVLDENSDMDVTLCGTEDCDACIIIMSGDWPGDLPDVDLSRPDPLPLKVKTAPVVAPIVHADSFTARN